jgi:hypothetical protein
MEGFSYRICAACGTSYQDSTECPNCGRTAPVEVVNGYVTGFGSGTVPCAGCGSTDEPLLFRGWSRLLSFFIWARDMRMGGYVCASCARKQTAIALTVTSVFGWLSFPSWFFYGWRSTYLNWRSVFAMPPRPNDWGAMSAAEFMDAMQVAQEEAFAEVEDWVLSESPLGRLTEEELRTVMTADDIYAVLGVDHDATHDELRTAYRRRSKEAHPDLRNGSGSVEDMIRINQAWEVLRDTRLREAYDWADENLERVA